MTASGTSLGIDLGTSGVKALLLDEDQRPLASATAPLSVQRPRSGWSEQDPAAWIAATEQALNHLQQDAPAALAAVRGIGLSGQMHGATLLDDQDQVIRPCLLWNDVRSHAQAARLDADPQFRARSGNIVFPGFTAPKTLWVQEQEPQLFARLARVLLPKDYLRLWLTGEAVSDLSDASGTSWLNVGARDWDEVLLAACGLGRQHMPRLVEGSAPSGQLRPALAQRWGLETSVLVAGGAGDNAAAACGLGVVAEGQAFLSLGTSGVLFAATEGFRPNADSAVHSFCHALPACWHQMGVILSATDALNWLAELLGQSPAALTAALPTTSDGPARPLCLPYFSGERTPHNDAQVRAAFVGVDRADGAAALTQALLEGVAFALKDNLAALAAAGSQPERLTIVGGGGQSPQWVQILADVLGLPIDLPADGELGAAFGAARLGLACTRPEAERPALFSPAAIVRSVEPRSRLADAYAAQYARFTHLYPALKQGLS